MIGLAQRATWKVWAAARISLNHDELAFVNGGVLDQLIVWRMEDHRYNPEGTKCMQRQWTIEARADFADQEKNDAVTQAMREAASHINAVVKLLQDGVKAQVVCFSDDFFAGHQEIDIMPDTIGKAIADCDVGEESPISQEMLDAFRDLGSDGRK